MQQNCTRLCSSLNAFFKLNCNVSSEKKTDSILQSHSLKKTSTRVDVLNLFINKPYALAHSDIERELEKDHDRVTLYRTLNTFEDTGITHKVMGEDGVAKYALCDECNEHHHHDDHIHFDCSQCHKTYCLDNGYTPKLVLPEGYVLEEHKVTVKGICTYCNQKQ